MEHHRFDPISFIFGLGFVAVALLFVLPTDPWEIYFGGVSLGWLWPLIAIAAGVALLAPLVRDMTRGEPDEELDSEEHAEALSELGEPPTL